MAVMVGALLTVSDALTIGHRAWHGMGAGLELTWSADQEVPDLIIAVRARLRWPQLWPQRAAPCAAYPRRAIWPGACLHLL